jgi:hypothetical protein
LKHKNRKDLFDLPTQFKLFHNHPLIIKELFFFFFFLPLKQTNKQSFIHPLTLLTSWILNLDFIGIGLMPKQTTSLLPSFQNNNSLSLSLFLSFSFLTTLQDRLEEEWRMSTDNEMAT